MSSFYKQVIETIVGSSIHEGYFDDGQIEKILEKLITDEVSFELLKKEILGK